MNFFKRLQTKKIKKSEIFQLYSCSDHYWIRGDRYILESFKELEDYIFKNNSYAGYFIDKPLLFLRAAGVWSITLDYQKDQNIIIVFDELYKVLRSARPRLGQAVLAHELGHIYHGHSGSEIDPLKAQVQADEFAAKLGYAQEMLEVLNDLDFGQIEIRVRVSYLTSYLAKYHPEVLTKNH